MSYLANKLKAKSSQYARRKIRTNTQVKNGTDGVRVIVSRSNKFVSAQAVDTAGNVVASISDKGQKGSKKECAVAAGKAFAKLLQDKNVDQIAFDRNGFLYHGRVAAFADGMREGGIKL